ncbi:hypothetical protein ACFR9U_09900 [Halorientalis brevis]|uniref:DUF2795 domain-containing protein n=1 Tax=Halorientalis brevis TaxID=1126241 RepID=A0ABD6CAC8_9EURY|nr:hypothetical protein [Halorientalis brevis]
MVPNDPEQSDPNHERVQEQARDRTRERTDSVESMLGRVGMLDEAKYPVTSEELAVEYADETVDLPNETESLGSVFDRLTDERFESPAEAQEAVLNELTGEQAGPEEYNDERSLENLQDDEGESDPLE